MSKDSAEYEHWKTEVYMFLDTLVAKNFERLFHADRNEYNTIWGEIGRDLYARQGLQGMQTDDPDYAQKRCKQRYISLCLEIYSEEEFPWELASNRIYRFVKQFGKLPKQLPDEWKTFEAADRIQEIAEQHNADKQFDECLKNIAAKYPEYMYR